MSCDVLDHVTIEIRSNKARVTLQLDESTRDVGTTVGQGVSKKVEGIGTIKNQTNCYQYVCTCLATILTSQIKEEITENHAELCGCAKRCNKFVSNQS